MRTILWGRIIKEINNYTPEANNVESFAVASLTLLKTRGKSWTHLAKSRKLGSLYVYRKLTTYPPLSQHFALSEKYSKCLLRGGVGRQFPRNVKWSERKLNRVKDSFRKHPAWVYVTLRYGSKKFVKKHSHCIWIVFDKPRPLRPSAGRHQRLWFVTCKEKEKESENCELRENGNGKNKKTTTTKAGKKKNHLTR